MATKPPSTPNKTNEYEEYLNSSGHNGSVQQLGKGIAEVIISATKPTVTAVGGRYGEGLIETIVVGADEKIFHRSYISMGYSQLILI